MNKVIFFAILIFAVVGVTLNLSLNRKQIDSKSPLYMGHPASACKTVGQLIPDDTNCTIFYECDALLIPERFVCALEHTCFSPSANLCDYTGCYVPC